MDYRSIITKGYYLANTDGQSNISIILQGYSLKLIFAKTFSFLYNIGRDLINKVLTLKYNITEFITKSFTFVYHIGNLLSKKLTFIYHHSGIVNTTFQFLYIIRQEASKSLNFIYHILEIGGFTIYVTAIFLKEKVYVKFIKNSIHVKFIKNTITAIFKGDK